MSKGVMRFPSGTGSLKVENLAASQFCVDPEDGGVWRHLLQKELPVLDPGGGTAVRSDAAVRRRQILHIRDWSFPQVDIAGTTGSLGLQIMSPWSFCASWRGHHG